MADVVITTNSLVVIVAVCASVFASRCATASRSSPPRLVVVLSPINLQLRDHHLPLPPHPHDSPAKAPSPTSCRCPPTDAFCIIKRWRVSEGRLLLHLIVVSVSPFPPPPPPTLCGLLLCGTDTPQGVSSTPSRSGSRSSGTSSMPCESLKLTPPARAGADLAGGGSARVGRCPHPHFCNR